MALNLDHSLLPSHLLSEVTTSEVNDVCEINEANRPHCPNHANNASDINNQDLFSQVVERLKSQRALPRDSFPKDLPFFTFDAVSRESQIKSLFQDVSDPNMYKNLLLNIVALPEEKSPELINQRLSAMQVMSFAQIVLYKVLPCCEENCANAPREVITHNQYKDYEFECPFYHHDKDHRRIVLPPSIDGEFAYKANYFEDSKHNPQDKDKHSQNYFESMFHPLYYKMFRCKREYCNFSQFCPFYHSEDEKKTWDKVFANFIRKDRIAYVKNKQNYFEKSDNQRKFNRNNNSNNTEQPVSARFRNFCSNPSTPQANNFRRPNGQLTCIKHLQPVGSGSQNSNDWAPRSAQKWDNKKLSNTFRKLKNSDDLASGNSSAVPFGRKNQGIWNQA